MIPPLNLTLYLLISGTRRIFVHDYFLVYTLYKCEITIYSLKFHIEEILKEPHTNYILVVYRENRRLATSNPIYMYIKYKVSGPEIVHKVARMATIDPNRGTSRYSPATKSRLNRPIGSAMTPPTPTD